LVVRLGGKSNVECPTNARFEQPATPDWYAVLCSKVVYFNAFYQTANPTRFDIDYLAGA